MNKFRAIDAKSTDVAVYNRVTDRDLKRGRKLANYALRKAEAGHLGEEMLGKTSRLSPTLPHYSEASVAIAQELLYSKGIEMDHRVEVVGGTTELGPWIYHIVELNYIDVTAEAPKNLEA